MGALPRGIGAVVVDPIGFVYVRVALDAWYCDGHVLTDAKMQPAMSFGNLTVLSEGVQLP